MPDEAKKSHWTKFGMVIGGVLLVLMSGTGTVNSFLHKDDSENTYEAFDPLIEALIEDSGDCAEDIARMKSDIAWLKDISLRGISPAASAPKPKVRVRKPKSYKVLEELADKVDPDFAPEPGELPDFDSIQEAF